MYKELLKLDNFKEPNTKADKRITDIILKTQQQPGRLSEHQWMAPHTHSWHSVDYKKGGRGYKVGGLYGLSGEIEEEGVGKWGGYTLKDLVVYSQG